MSDEKEPKKVVFCIPTMTKPYQQTLDALRDSIPLIVGAGWEEGCVNEIGCPYISAARATMLRKALDAKATVIVFIDHDVSWEPPDLLRLIETDGDVVAGTYRFKKGEAEQGCKDEEYMGTFFGPGQHPIVRGDGCIKMLNVPAGFLKVTRNAVNRFMEKYPELCYGEYCAPAVDLFNHGAHERVWFGEDYAFCRRWNAIGDVWCVPNLNITHWTKERGHKGNLHMYLRRRPGGDLSDCPIAPQERLKALQRAAPKEPSPSGQ
jgi:glycosyltransferase involved in cell wall biosynthesis